MLRKSIENYALNQILAASNLGPNYTLPGNITVVKFAFKMIYRKCLRLVYGLFYEKSWNIVLLKTNEFRDNLALSVRKGVVPPVGSRYRFYADPFFSAAGDKIRVEALNARNGLGEIIELQTDNCCTIKTLMRGGHYSYPFSFKDGDREYICPEVASHSAPYLLLQPSDGKAVEYLRGLENIKALDGTHSQT